MTRFAFLAAMLIGCKPAPRAALTIAAASDLKFALDELLVRYRKRHPQTDVLVTYGSSGNFYAQLTQQAPFDVFLSADVDFPKKLAAAGHGLDAVFPYAVGHLVVWVPKSSPQALDKLGIKALTEPTMQKVAIANPKTAPYGRAAVAALQSLGVYATVEPKLVFGENVAQAAQFVRSGAADGGVIALSIALAEEMQRAGHYWNVPLESYPTLEQGGLILKWAKAPEEARRFRDFFQSAEARAVLDKFGFVLPAAK
jgi:molybdate transport system substrate-binding protein